MLTRQQEMAGQANVLPAHLQSMGEPRIRAPAPYLMQAHGIGNIGGVPEDDRGDDEAAASAGRSIPVASELQHEPHVPGTYDLSVVRFINQRQR